MVTNGSGVGYVTVDSRAGMLSTNLRLFDLSAPATAAHIHSGAAGANGPVAFTLGQNGADEDLWEFQGELDEEQLTAFQSAQWYFNAHTDDGAGGGFPAGEVRGQILQADFRLIQDTVFKTSCASVGCHTGNDAPLGLQLDNDQTYGLLLGVPAGEVPELARVHALQPEDSYLIQKLEGTAAVGSQMPLGADPLPQVTIDNIRRWIEDGAFR